eukprot:366361-Chlamydomonas_euryale.AAC.3
MPGDVQVCVRPRGHALPGCATLQAFHPVPHLPNVPNQLKLRVLVSTFIRGFAVKGAFDSATLPACSGGGRLAAAAAHRRRCNARSHRGRAALRLLLTLDQWADGPDVGRRVVVADIDDVTARRRRRCPDMRTCQWHGMAGRRCLSAAASHHRSTDAARAESLRRLPGSSRQAHDIGLRRSTDREGSLVLPCCRAAVPV